MSANKTLKFVLFIVVILFGVCLGQLFNLDVHDLKEKVAQYPRGLSGLIFVAIYVGLTTVLWFGPKDVLRISSALVFGGITSTVFVWIAELINSVIMFHTSRILGYEFVHQRTRVDEQRIKALEQSRSWLGVLAWRINPIVPLRFSDLGYGLTNISFLKYVIPSMIAILPRIFWQQYIFAGVDMSYLKDPQKMIEYMQGDMFILKYSAVYFLVTLLICCAAGIVKFRRKKVG